MKSALKRLFSRSSLNPYDNVQTKEEAFFRKRHKDFKHPKSNDKFKQVNKLNPVDKNGKISRCIICDSKLHWEYKYPHKNDQNVNILEDSDTEANIVLITENLLKLEIFVAEASKSVINNQSEISYQYCMHQNDSR